MKYFYWTCGAIFIACLVFFVFVPAFAGNLAIPSQVGIGSFAIKLYGITMALAILTGYLVARKYSWRFGISPQNVDDISFWITIFGLIGARLYYVIFEWQFFSSNLSEIYKIWHGGIAIYGAIITGAIFIMFYARRKAYSVYQLLDLAALSLPLGQAVGRFGNFFNQEAFGLPTNLPWKMYIDLPNRPLEYRNESFYHPAFLYEAIINVIIFFILTRFFLNKGKPGVVAFWYIGLYSLGRFFIEAIRLDSSFIFGIKVNQLAAVLGIMIAGAMLIFRYRKETGLYSSPERGG